MAKLPLLYRIAGPTTARSATIVLFSGIALAASLQAAKAGAYATIGIESKASPPTLPDGRAYEQVSPVDKNGNNAGTTGGAGQHLYSVARADGNAVLFGATGAVGDAVTGATNSFFVARRSGSGWKTNAALPRWLGERANLLLESPRWILPGADLSHFAFVAQLPYVPPPDTGDSSNIFIAGPDPSHPPVWVGRPMIAHPVGTSHYLIPVGGSPDLSTLYFTYAGALLPEDEHIAPNSNEHGDAWGFYEYHGGTLTEAGVLPNGSIDPFGAVPAALAPRNNVLRRIANPDQFGNEVSFDGSRAFFVSPDPASSFVSPFEDKAFCESNTCTMDPPELYMHETTSGGTMRTVLVSQSRLTGHVGVPAPHGPAAVASTSRSTEGESIYSFVFASPDGSHAFFSSIDPLTNDAPSDSSMKTYEFDLVTEELTYLPRLVGSIVTSTEDGSSVVFENSSASSPELDQWSAGPNGGLVTKIVQLPGETRCATGSPVETSNVCVGPARTSTDGSVVVFETDAPIAGFNDSGGFEQVYRYDAAGNVLNCLSCPPPGVIVSGNAVMSGIDERGNEEVSGAENAVVDDRGMSSDGSQVFFDTPDQLVPKDNDGKRDVYEWENGVIFLISTGTSTKDSSFLDSSASGSDVFFTTASSILPTDTDGAYDVYDARIPHPGDEPPPTPGPCQGDACQGPPSVPQLLTAPTSMTFNGSGNLTPPVKPKLLARAQNLAKALKACRTKPKHDKHRRAVCESQARYKYRRKTEGKPKSHKEG